MFSTLYRPILRIAQFQLHVVAKEEPDQQKRIEREDPLYEYVTPPHITAIRFSGDSAQLKENIVYNVREAVTSRQVQPNIAYKTCLVLLVIDNYNYYNYKLNIIIFTSAYLYTGRIMYILLDHSALSLIIIFIRYFSDILR